MKLRGLLARGSSDDLALGYLSLLEREGPSAGQPTHMRYIRTWYARTDSVNTHEKPALGYWFSFCLPPTPTYRLAHCLDDAHSLPTSLDHTFVVAHTFVNRTNEGACATLPTHGNLNTTAYLRANERGLVY